MNRSAAVLRNKGVAVTVNALVQVEDEWEVQRKSDGEAKSETAWIRFDGNVLADLEDGWGDLASYQVASATNPFGTIRRTMAIAFGWDDDHARSILESRKCRGCQRAGLAMRDGSVDEYTTAIGAAMALANGLDPTRVVQMLANGEAVQKDVQAAKLLALDEMLSQVGKVLAESTSRAGSANGSGPAAATTSSGA